MKRGREISALAFAGLVGCGGGPGAQGGESKSAAAVTFPSAETIANVQATAIHGDTGDTVSVERFEMDAATVPAPGAPPTQADEDAMHVLAPNISTSAALACAAREMAHIVAMKNALPPLSLREFAVARCGGSVATASFGAVQWQHVDKISDIDLVQKSVGKLLLDFGNWPFGGVGVSRDGENAAVAVFVARPRADVEPWQAKAMDASVTLRGTVHTPAAHVTAAANAGRFGYVHCARDWSVSLPRFAFQCPMAAGDGSAWMEVYTIAPKAILSDVAARVLVVRDGASAVYESSTGSPQPAADANAFSTTLLGRVNDVRKDASLPPLDSATAQAATNSRVTGALINAGIKGEYELVNRMSLALIAGWDVTGTIRTGSLFTAFQPTIDPFVFTTAAIAHPIGRMVLLDPAASQIAVGSAFTDKSDGAGAVITSYATFDRVDHAADRQTVIRELDARRIGKGFEPSETITFPEVDQAVRAIQNGTAPMQAAKDAMSEASQRLGKNVNLWVLEGTDIGRLAFPDELLYRTPPRVAVAVTHHKVQGAAWGQYVVLLYAVGLPTAMVASSPSERAHY